MGENSTSNNVWREGQTSHGAQIGACFITWIHASPENKLAGHLVTHWRASAHQHQSRGHEILKQMLKLDLPNQEVI